MVSRAGSDNFNDKVHDLFEMTETLERFESR